MVTVVMLFLLVASFSYVIGSAVVKNNYLIYEVNIINNK